MSQTSVTRHYSIRKRNANHVEVSKPPQNIMAEDGKVNEIVTKKVRCGNLTELEKKDQIVKTTRKTKTAIDNSNTLKSEVSKDACKKKKPAPAKKGKKPTTGNDKSHGKQSTIKTFFTTESDNLKNDQTKNAKAKNCTSCVRQDRISSPFNVTVDPPSHSLQQSPKRNHPIPSDEGTPSKKKHLEESVSSVTEDQAIDKPKMTSRRKLKLDSLSSQSKPDFQSPEAKLVTASPQKKLNFPDKLDALVDKSRSKLISSPKLEELKKALQEFSEKTTKLKKLQSNPYMINCIASSSNSQPMKKPLPAVPACERFNHLLQSDSLVLPFKYNVLSEIFRSVDSLVATLHNRKERIVFDNVKEGVQRIMKRNFSEKDLAQIVTVFPSAYNMSREKASYIGKKNGSSEFQLIITPNLNADKGTNKKLAAFQHMSPSILTSRINYFNRNLLDLVKTHHQDFLTRINFVPVSKDSILRWHPKFPVDSVPDIPVTQLPESPEMKIHTAKNILNKFKGSFRSKVETDLPSLPEETDVPDATIESKKLNIPKSETSKDLKGICFDLLEKIRGKEAVKLLTTMNQIPSETKELVMMERVPKIVNILFLFFISERKAALPVDKIVDKLIHSFNSLSTPDEVKEHLKLIQEKFPFWLNFVQIPKGVYLTVNKSTNINKMLDNAGLQ